jgi:hypothetical protein
MDKKPVTLHYRLGNEREFLKKVLQENERVTIRRTNYSIKVETDRRNYLFANSGTATKRSFIAYNKILSDIKKSGLATPSVTSRHVKYWWFKDKERYPQNFYSVDINAAYPTALYNVGAIRRETYDYLLTRISKIDRLRCVGMLATQKGVYHYTDGKLTDFEVDTSDYSGWFFMCCVVIGEVMEMAKARFKSQVLHYWVDGIAIEGDPWELLCYIEYLGFQSKVEVITDCRLVNNWLIYDKDGKKKYLHLPKRVEVSDAEIKRFLDYGDVE